ncbi:MAG: fatty acid desaturase [Hasllibacter sp.]
MRFVLATLGPLALIQIAAFQGGPWAWAALASVTLALPVVDLLAPGTRREGAEFAAPLAFCALLAAAILVSVPLLGWALSRPDGPGAAARAATALAAGFWFGQLGHACGHELIHAAARPFRALGAAVYSAFLYGHHAAAHRLIHHRHVATDRDPASAPAGQGFWSYAPRAWIGAWRAGRGAEILRGRPWVFPAYVAAAAAFLAVSSAAGGWAALGLHLFWAAHVQLQVLLSDYVQHYGLRRAEVGGRPEPVGPAHSWEAPGPWSQDALLNAPRHADHHVHPARAFPDLAEGVGPTLPYPVPVMATIALVPPLWRRIVDPRLPGRRPRSEEAALPAFG